MSEPSAKRQRVVRSRRQELARIELHKIIGTQYVDVVLAYCDPYMKVDNFGILIHWGLYSVPAFDSVRHAERRRIQNGSEWYLARLYGSSKPWPMSGEAETRAYHNRNYPGQAYHDFKNQFTASAYDPDEWVQLFREAGASYAILTARHHDGFCLWPTKTTPTNSVSSASCGGGTRDPLLEFKGACGRAGLAFGVYYSWFEFNTSFTKEYCAKIVRPQLVELCAKYKPDIFWFDGDWECTTVVGQKFLDESVQVIKRKLPRAQVNDRIGHKKEKAANQDYLGLSTYRVYGDRTIPTTRPNVPWEHVNTIGLSWGHNAQQQTRDYKSGADLAKLYRQVAALGGRFCLNVGPDANGRVCADERASLSEFGQLL